MITSYVTVILLLLVGLIVAGVAYVCAEARAAEADRARDRAATRAEQRQAEARRTLREARRANAVARYYQREAVKVRARLATYAISEEEQLASLPREVTSTVELPADIDVQIDRFLDDLLRGL